MRPSITLPFVALAFAGVVALSFALILARGDAAPQGTVSSTNTNDTFAADVSLMQFSRELEKAQDADRLDRAMHWLAAMLTIDQQRAAEAAALAAYPPAAPVAPAESRPAARVVISGTLPQQLLALINARRASAGLGPLAVNASLAQVAGAFAQELLVTRRASHTGVDGATISTRLAASGFGSAAGGEVIAFGTAGWPASDIVDAWMASPTHRAILMSPLYSLAGPACASDGVEVRCVIDVAG